MPAEARLRTLLYLQYESGALPHFKLGAVICAKKSTLLALIAQQERQCIEDTTR